MLQLSIPKAMLTQQKYDQVGFSSPACGAIVERAVAGWIHASNASTLMRSLVWAMLVHGCRVGHSTSCGARAIVQGHTCMHARPHAHTHAHVHTRNHTHTQIRAEEEAERLRECTFQPKIMSRSSSPTAVVGQGMLVHDRLHYQKNSWEAKRWVALWEADGGRQALRACPALLWSGLPAQPGMPMWACRQQA